MEVVSGSLAVSYFFAMYFRGDASLVSTFWEDSLLASDGRPVNSAVVLFFIGTLRYVPDATEYEGR